MVSYAVCTAAQCASYLSFFACRVARTALGEHLQKATATAGRGFY